MITLSPIGYFQTSAKMRYHVPRQPNTDVQNQGIIQLNPKSHYEQCLEGLIGFERIWVIFQFHQAHHWKPKVMPPRGGKKQGVFATRSPHRPNFIGMSCVELVEIKGLKIRIANHDLIDQTPILDIKPYLSYADAFINCRQGWVDELPSEKSWQVQWLAFASDQINYLVENQLCFKHEIELRLITSPLPYPNNRVKKIDDQTFVLHYQTWQIFYQIDQLKIDIQEIHTGYDQKTLEGKKISKWNDIELHRNFQKKFYPEKGLTSCS